jgi:hypothetical protein
LRGEDLYFLKQQDMPAVLETAVRTVRAGDWKKYAACFKGIRIGVASGLTNGERQRGTLYCE